MGPHAARPWKWALLPALVACIAVLTVYQRRRADEPVNEEPLSLMQSYALVTSSRLALASRNTSLLQDVVLASSVEALAADGVIKASAEAQNFQHLEVCHEEYQPLTQQAYAEVLRFLGILPPRKSCRPLALLSVSAHHTICHVISLVVPIVYTLGFGLVVLRMLRFVLAPRLKGEDRRPPHVRGMRRPEADAWKEGLLSWLSISWASEWVARWGSVTASSPTSIRAEELDALGDPADEPSVGFQRLLPIWDEELRKKGMKEASLMKVMIRFVTVKRLLLLGAWTTGYEVSLYLGPPLAIQYTINYVTWLYTVRLQGYEVEQASLGVPSFMIILTFTGLPLFMAICNTVSSFLSQRMAIQSCGALSSLVVKKAQSLPVTVEALASQIKEAKKEYSKAEDSDEELLEDTAEDKMAEMDESVMLDNSRWMAPEQFNLVQVVANDINMSFVNVPLQFIRILVIVPVIIVLFAMLWVRIRLAILFVLLTAAFFTWLLVFTAHAQIMWLMGFLYYAGNRLQYLESTIHSIRAIKACGWEGIVDTKILEMRGVELVALRGYYKRLGLMYTVVYTIPKALIFVAIFGYHLLYPHDPAVNIFATLPLLFTAQNALMSLLQTLPMIINAKPAITRCERFLKQVEAPIGRPKAENAPKWLSLWPKNEAGVGYTLRVRGDFSWKLEGKPVLAGMELDVHAGKSLAVIGQTGSGKTTLLHAILGELYPLGDAHLEAPSRMSYSAQVPYVCEGTLRENVLFGETVDQEHYKTAIFSACLMPELELLPGGEDVPIGSRGISLSGGQKARVSMARAAYTSTPGGLVLIDDPFGAVDSRTARHLLDHLIHGEGLEGRTRVVVTQPDPERIARFDEVAVMIQGRIAVKGSPSEVMRTEEYKALLDSHQLEALGTQEDAVIAITADALHGRGTGSKAPEVFQLREEEFQGRVDWKTVNYFCSEGCWPLFMVNASLFLLMQVMYLMMNVALQHWSTDQLLLNAGIGASAPIVAKYMKSFLIWWAASYVTWFTCWSCGMNFTLNASSRVFTTLIAGLLHAPVDRFFDRTPVGRIMNRLSSDLTNLDNNTYTNITTLIGLAWITVVPIAYIHFLMPIYFSMLLLPVYYLIFMLVRRYWNTMVPMRYLTHVSKSATDDILTEVAHSNVSVRAMQKADFRLSVFQSLLSNQIKADVTTTLVLQRWLVNRLFLLLGFMVTVLVLIAIWIPAIISFGGIGLCMVNCFQIVTGVEGYISSAASAQFEFISLNRLYEYTRLPQERPNELPGDGKYKSFGVKVARALLGKLEQREQDGLKIILRRSPTGQEDVVLSQVAGTESFQAPEKQNLAVLAQGMTELEETTSWHRIIAANGTRGDAKHIADALCSEAEDDVGLEVQSGWLTDGCEIVIEDLRTGYGDIPRDILKDVSVVIEARSKAGIVGTTGCGKSTLLLSLLRILEPRGGRIRFNGIDTQHVGLQTLRTAVGLVPQDPVLMQSSVRENLDPFGLYSDEEVWKGLRMVQLEDAVKGMEYGIFTPIAVDGGNLSFGQRQLLCLARTVIRQPALILLDEATSALDPHTQELVQSTIQSSFPRSTIVVIAHRLETILNFDMIIVMEQGDIVERGSASDLSSVNGGVFAKMLAAKRTW